jgi:hypothetical protein
MPNTASPFKGSSRESRWSFNVEGGKIQMAFFETPPQMKHPSCFLHVFGSELRLHTHQTKPNPSSIQRESRCIFTRTTRPESVVHASARGPHTNRVLNPSPIRGTSFLNPVRPHISLTNSDPTWSQSRTELGSTLARLGAFAWQKRPVDPGLLWG